jgi:phosphoglycerate kinase
MAYTFIKATGGSIGKSLCEEDRLDYARRMIEKAKTAGKKLLLPADTVAAAEFSPDSAPVEVDSYDIPDDLMGLDIGSRAVAQYAEEIQTAGTVCGTAPWAFLSFPHSRKERLRSPAPGRIPAVSIVCGGDSAAAARQFGFADQMTHISTGGGASLEFLEGIDLPGVSCLLDKESNKGRTECTGNTVKQSLQESGK